MWTFLALSPVKLNVQKKSLQQSVWAPFNEKFTIDCDPVLTSDDFSTPVQQLFRYGNLKNLFVYLCTIALAWLFKWLLNRTAFKGEFYMQIILLSKFNNGTVKKSGSNLCKRSPFAEEPDLNRLRPGNWHPWKRGWSPAWEGCEPRLGLFFYSFDEKKQDIWHKTVAQSKGVLFHCELFKQIVLSKQYTIS